ncbi:M3 family metallopeptidase [Rhizosphaericola mali]|uniref:M3 family metallopeptidase n=1 Tax=Rhizosphaericola mali TaxID=2545455 RepID=A0A5P2G0Y0_9BACT|nr:M3 family metallopeptidase [Rhizosphaericola mali]QES89464.1 M3 family metallopeptidase [Rhizosphaericola mali]
MANILLEKWNTPFGSIPFEEIKNEDYKPAFLQGIEDGKKEIDAIAQNEATPTFENTIEALDASGQVLDKVAEIFFNLNSAETNDFFEELAQEVSPLLAEYSNDITLNEALFARIKYVKEHTPIESLTEEQARLLDKTFKSFSRNGALLSDTDKETLREIDKELSGLTVKFSQNVLQETNAYTLHLTEEKDLEGLPESIVEMAKEEATKRNLEGWVFTLQFPSMVPFMKYAKNRDLREKMSIAIGQRAYKDNEQNNSAIIHKLVSLRAKRAKLLGFDSHAAFVLEERMAQNPKTVLSFLDDLLFKAKPFAVKEIEVLKDLAAQDGIEDMKSFDHSYYAEKLREAKYEFSEEELKPYFSLEKVLEAAFTAAERLYGLKYTERKDIQKYHPEVTVYEVTENGQYKGLFYTDFFPRDGKRPGAWETSYQAQYKNKEVNQRPHVSIVCNFSRPSKDKPSLLTFGEVTTLFHEFGHSLHAMLADTTYRSLSGTSVYWDFVELPSQFMENYCYDKDFLQSFAKHYKTGETLPAEKIDKIVASANFMEGYQTIRQLSFGILDMAFHTGKLSENATMEDFEDEILSDTKLYPTTAGLAMSPSFSHIFAGGYSAGYYSYKWSEVLDADAFEFFKENGIFNPEIAAKFKTLLSSGGTKDPMELYKNFRGREPKVEALLKRAGLAEA